MPDDEMLRTLRQRFGENLRNVRQRRDMGQRELADLMTAKGYRWYQNTVARTEAGDRTPSIFETGALAAILDVTTERFLWLPEEAAGVAYTGDALNRLLDAYRDAVAAVAELQAARLGAEYALRSHRGSRYQRVLDKCEALSEFLEGRTLEAALAEGAALPDREGKA